MKRYPQKYMPQENFSIENIENILISWDSFPK